MLQKTKSARSRKYVIKTKNKHLKNYSLLKFKIKGLKNSSGRNNSGKITSYHKGGGHKQKYRFITFDASKNSVGIVTSIEYDPNRTSNIASVYNFFLKDYYYIIAPNLLKIGDIIKTGLNAEVYLGHSVSLSKIPEGCLIYNISLKENKLPTVCRSAGNFAYVMEKTSKYCCIKLPSGEQKKVSIKCYASIGIVSNKLDSLKIINKAGRSRWLNRRPTVRGVAMNPIDHPHGGGEGRTSGKDLTPWGKPNKRGKTSNSKTKLRIN